ncbi:MAG: PD-(D/E)XK nuclease family protein, partial [Janthinobacterium lividum]
MLTSRQALEVFAENNSELAQLEKLLKRFNLFEAIGVIRQELRHSDLLACLLDPRQNHGLGTLFIRELLDAVSLTPYGDFVASPFDLDLSVPDQVLVLREWRHTDILILDEANQFAVILENKIDTGEHSGQLERYYKHVLDEYPDYTITALYLTRDGNAPTFDRYIPVSYSLVCQVVEKIAVEHHADFGIDIMVLLEHYALMLRRHILSDSGEADLCRSIYQKHKQALDLIIQHIPDQETLISEFAAQLIKSESSTIKSCFSQKSYIQFNPLAWDGSFLYRDRIPMCPWFLYFQFSNDAGSLTIVLLMTPGIPAHRDKVFQAAQASGFQGCPESLIKATKRNGWSRLFEKPILVAKDYDKSQEEIEEIISQKWSEFLRDDLPHITETILQEKWLWVPLPPGTAILNPKDQQTSIKLYVSSLIEESQG